MAQRTLVECDSIRVTRRAQEPSKLPKKARAAPAGTAGEGEDETDAKSFASDLTQDLEQTITNVLTKTKRGFAGSASVSKKQVQKFLDKATIEFTGYSNKKSGKEPKRLMSQKKSLFKNKTKAEVTYAFRRSAEHCTTAHLTVQKGLTIGVLAGIGGGAMGAPASLGGGLGFRKTKELSSGSSQMSSREMEVQVSVPGGESVTATESVFNIE